MADITINNVRDFFQKMAEYYKIPIDGKWSSKLWGEIKEELNVSSAGLFRTWMSRDHIPEHAIESLLSLDIPDDLKDFCKKRKKKTLSIKQHDKIGKYLQNSYDQFGKLMCFLSEYYPHKVHEKNIQNITKQLNDLRSSLDCQVFKEFPGLKTKEKGAIYYRKSGKPVEIAEVQKKFGEEINEDIISLFVDETWAKDINLDLIEIEKLDPDKKEIISTFIQGILIGLKPKKIANHS